MLFFSSTFCFHITCSCKGKKLLVLIQVFWLKASGSDSRLLVQGLWFWFKASGSKLVVLIQGFWFKPSGSDSRLLVLIQEAWLLVLIQVFFFSNGLDVIWSDAFFNNFKQPWLINMNEIYCYLYISYNVTMLQWSSFWSPNLKNLSRVSDPPKKTVSIKRLLKSWNIEYDFKWNRPYLSWF